MNKRLPLVLTIGLALFCSQASAGRHYIKTLVVTNKAQLDAVKTSVVNPRAKKLKLQNVQFSGEELNQTIRNYPWMRKIKFMDYVRFDQNMINAVYGAATGTNIKDIAFNNVHFSSADGKDLDFSNLNKLSRLKKLKFKNCTGIDEDKLMSQVQRPKVEVKIHTTWGHQAKKWGGQVAGFFQNLVGKKTEDRPMETVGPIDIHKK